MECAWSEFEESLSDTASSDDFTTQFRYPLKDVAHDAVEKGLATLKLCAPYLFVFNQEFSSIAIKSRDGVVEFKAIERKQLEEEVGLQQVTVEEGENGNLRKTKYFLAQGGKTSVSIPLGPGDDVKCLDLDEIPRLFLGFPLVGTENFSFPRYYQQHEIYAYREQGWSISWPKRQRGEYRKSGSYRGSLHTTCPYAPVCGIVRLAQRLRPGECPGHSRTGLAQFTLASPALK